MILQSFYICKT
jgi:hypothetical protein